MSRLNFSLPNEFDSRIHSGPRPDDLSKMLLAMQEQSLQQQRDDYTRQPGVSPAYSLSTPPGGLLGRWHELQAAQQQPVSSGEDRRQMPSAPAGPRFRLVRVSPSRQPHDRINVSDRFSYSAFRDDVPSDALGASNFGKGVSDTSTDPIKPGSQYAQGPILCLGGPGPCAVGTSQAILGGVATLLGGATILKQNKLPAPGRPASTPTDESSGRTGVVPRTDQSSESGSLVRGGDNQNPCLERWLGEHASCERFWRARTRRFQDACKARANDRLSLCDGNKRTPHPEEPAEYSWKDIARDRFRP